MSDDVSPKDAIVADNDRIIRDILRALLEDQGFTVLQVTDGRAAIDYAMRTRARLVILDFKMPRLDGISACAEIRQLPDYADTPIVILTAFDDEETRAAASQAGVTEVLGKPFRPIDLIRCVRTLLGGATVGDQVAEPVSHVWKRRQEPQPLFGEPPRLVEGRRVLNICRR
jgi:DNA-binding response OmpR family regulator